jgi:LPPG:FO 2-phospho-L-lactate transferase
MITVLCGGVGGSRFLRALASVVDPARITAVVNTGDDQEFHGLHISPDPDIVIYTLAGLVDEERGWGFRGETFRWLDHMRRFGHETWFQIGDRDLATHLHRTRLLRDGRTLSEATAEIAQAFGVTVRVLPMSGDRVRTVVQTDAGDLSFQRYLVERHASDSVRGVRFDGADEARPASGVIDAIASAEAIFIAPSNPIASIGPILAIPGVRGAIAASTAPVVAVSPIIGGRSLQQPAAEMMAGLGYDVSATALASIYDGVARTIIIDDTDRTLRAAVEDAGVSCVVGPTIMRDDTSRRTLGRLALHAAGIDA